MHDEAIWNFNYFELPSGSGHELEMVRNAVYEARLEMSYQDEIFGIDSLSWKNYLYQLDGALQRHAS